MRQIKGIERNDTSITVETFRERKRPCLVINKGNTCRIVATFINPIAADDFREALAYIMQVPTEEE